MLQQKRLRKSDLDLFYRIGGAGTSVVFLHGFGEDGEIWNTAVSFLSSGDDPWRFIVPDLPGSGRSPLKSPELSMESMALGVKEILDQEGVDRVVMIGHSMGGYITLAFAEQFGERLLAFGLFHSSALADDDDKKATRQRGIEFVRQNGAAKFLEQSIPNLFSDSYKQSHKAEVKNFIEQNTNFSDESIVQYYEAMMARPDRTHILKNFNGPILFVIGEHDNAIPLRDSLQQCHFPKMAYIHLLKNSGHMGMIEEAQHSHQILEKFLREVDG